MTLNTIKTAVFTISDRCYFDPDKNKDQSGLVLCKLIKEKDFTIVNYQILPDDYDCIQKTLKEYCDVVKVDLIITTGGTGFTSRDVTPEATKSVIEKEATGISIALITGSLKVTNMAMLSRLTAGIRGSTLIINFPGSPKACQQCFIIVDPILKHAIDQLKDNKEFVAKVHKQMQEQGTSVINEQSLDISDKNVMARTESTVTLKSVALRPRESEYPMIPLNEAINIVAKELCDVELEHEKISLSNLDDLIERTLVNDVLPEIPLPPFRASVKDGYAVINKDGAGRRKVIQKSTTAGTYHEDLKVTNGYCVRVSTGGAIPDGADAVVQVEDTKLLLMAPDGDEQEISIEKAPVLNQDIREIGCDISLGKPILNRCTELKSIQLGLLASVGVNQVDVYKKIVVSVLSTGDEIIEPGMSLSPGCVWDSNRTTLLALLKQTKFLVAMDLGIARDDSNQIYMKLKQGLIDSDVIITTGGVSMGEKDLLKEILKQDFNAKIHFGRVNLKPGKPTTFATCLFNRKKKLIFALPGNPVSAFVTCQLFVIPALKILNGKTLPTNYQVSLDPLSLFHRIIKVKLNLLNQTSRKLDPRPEFVRAILTYDNQHDYPSAIITGKQQSSRLLSLKDADVLVLLPPSNGNHDKIENNAIVKAILL